MSFSSSQESPDRMWGPPVSTQWAREGALLQGKSGQRMKLTTHLHPILKIKKGAIPLRQLHALVAYTRTNVFTCATFMLDCHVIQRLQISCLTVHLFIFVIMSVHLWNKFFSALRHLLRPWHSPKKGVWNVSYVAPFKMCLHLESWYHRCVRLCWHSWQTDHCKRFNVVVTYLNYQKSPIRTEEP